MFQQEFALRLVTRPGSDITILSKKLIIFEYKLYAKVDNAINVSRNDFRPPPQVESSVIRLVPLDPPPPVKLRNEPNHFFSLQLNGSRKYPGQRSNEDNRTKLTWMSAQEWCV